METANFKSFSELARLYSQEKWRYLSLLTIDGEILVPYNNNKVTAENKWKEVKKKFESTLLPEGVYLFKAKNQPGSRGVEDKIFVVKGNMEKMKREFQSRPLSEEQPRSSVPARLSDPPQITPAVLTWDSALKNMQEISELKIENRILKDDLQKEREKIADLEAELNDPELEEEEGAALPTWAEQIFPVLDTALNKFFEQRDRELNQREAAMKFYNVPVANGNAIRSPQTQMADGNKETLEFLRYMDGLLADNNMEQFTQEMNVLKTNNPTLYGQISEQLVQSGITLDENAG
jgi:hypothetical protein